MLPLVFTRAEALASGLTARQIDARVRSGEWTALRRGVYATTSLLPADPAERHAADVAAAARATAQDVVGSHESAAVVHRLTTFAEYVGPPILSRFRSPRGQRPVSSTAAVLVSHVPAHHRTTVLGADVTTIARTAVDLARAGPVLSAVVVLDSALRLGAGRAELDEALMVARGWPGSRRAAPLVAFADARAESALESVGRWRMFQFELPRPELQVNLYDADGHIGRVDFVFEKHRVVGEADGLRKYRAESGEEHRADPLAVEKLREDRLRDAGFEVFRFTWEIAVHRPVVLEQRARRAFERARLRHAA